MNIEYETFIRLHSGLMLYLPDQNKFDYDEYEKLLSNVYTLVATPYEIRYLLYNSLNIIFSEITGYDLFSDLFPLCKKETKYIFPNIDPSQYIQAQEKQTGEKILINLNDMSYIDEQTYNELVVILRAYYDFEKPKNVIPKNTTEALKMINEAADEINKIGEMEWV